MPFGDLSIGISTLAIASASAFKYKHCLLHSCKCLVLTDQSQSFQQSYNLLYKRNNSDTSKKVFQNIKEGTLQNPCQIIPVVEFVFNKIAGNELQTCIFAEKKFPPRMNFQRFFSVRSNSSFGKSAGCALQGRTLLKRCYTINFLKNVLLRKLVFGTISENNVFAT